MLLKNAGIFTARGASIEKGFVYVRNGRIVDVGPMKCCPEDSETYDLRGLWVYPGFVDAHCHIGMWADGAGFEGDDGNEDTDPATPQLRAIDAVNPGDRCFTEALESGVTSVVTGPGSANPVAGQLALLKTYGESVDDMIVRAPIAMKFALGENPKNTYHDKDQSPTTRMATAAIIREQLLKAQRYRDDMAEYEADESGETDEPEFDFKSMALLDVMDGRIQAHFHVHRSDDIFTAVRIIKEFGLKGVLIHCTEGYMSAAKLAEEKIPAVVGPVIGARTKPELANQSDGNAAALHSAGVLTAICTDHPVVPIKYLPLSAAVSVREGMEHDEAVRSITYYPARVLGVEDRIGSIAPGCDADMAVFSGDPLSVYEKPLAVIVGGKVAAGAGALEKLRK